MLMQLLIPLVELTSENCFRDLPLFLEKFPSKPESEEIVDPLAFGNFTWAWP
uniref:Uncharacterized protein n=1 Tax=Nelumbo nucifera TaxID=4432 RepID=A0A822YV30_NELNU|nr:TPA_asm: hypothetical protein HUJ06_005595 [Nelumbo nucifera]